MSEPLWTSADGKRRIVDHEGMLHCHELRDGTWVARDSIPRFGHGGVPFLVEAVRDLAQRIEQLQDYDSPRDW